MIPVPLSQIAEYLDGYLRIKEIPDEANAVNGLQVENSGVVGGIVAAVDASLATIEGACSLGMGEVTGSITPGKRADIICVSTGGPNLGVMTDPAHMLVTAAQPADVDTVIADGRVLKRAGALTTVDLPQAREDARRALAGVLARAAG